MSCGICPDLYIARMKFVKLLRPGEVVSGRGYKDRRYFMHTSRYENVNRRFKAFDGLSETFRKDVSECSICFHAVCNLVQMLIASGGKLLDISK